MLFSSSLTQKLRRIPKRHWRDWFGPYSPVTNPKLPLLVSLVGFAKFAWFVAFKASARNWNFTFSETENVRKILKSVSKNPGPRRLFRPVLPKRAPVSSAQAQFDVHGTPCMVLPCTVFRK